MKIKFKKIILVSVLCLVTLFCIYLILDRMIIIDRTDETLGEYEFIKTVPDMILEVEGTGKQTISSGYVGTKVTIKNIGMNNSNIRLEQGQEIPVNEYITIYKNRHISGLELVPGRSIYGMGTSYRRVRKGEVRTIYIKVNIETNKLWVLPKELTELN